MGRQGPPWQGTNPCGRRAAFGGEAIGGRNRPGPSLHLHGGRASGVRCLWAMNLGLIPSDVRMRGQTARWGQRFPYLSTGQVGRWQRGALKTAQLT